MDAAIYPYRLGRAWALPEPLRLIVLGASGIHRAGRRWTWCERTGLVCSWRAVTCRDPRVDELAPELAAVAAAQPDAPPPLIAVTAEAARERAAAHLWRGRLLAGGPRGLVEAVTCAEAPSCLVNGLVGAAGLGPTLAGAASGKTLALANKETLVVGGDAGPRPWRRGGRRAAAGRLRAHGHRPVPGPARARRT